MVSWFVRLQCAMRPMAHHAPPPSALEVSVSVWVTSPLAPGSYVLPWEHRGGRGGGVLRIPPRVIPRVPLWRSRIDRIAHPPGLQESPVAEGGDLADTEQTTQHILQDCRNHRLLREETWPTPAPIQEKLHGPVDVLQKTTDFISRAYSPPAAPGEDNTIHLGCCTASATT